MHLSRRSALVYGILPLAWLLVLGWQFAEHQRISRSARVALVNRARDISNTLGLVMRSQRRFGGLVFGERLDAALQEFIRQGELNSVALLNDAGEVVASAGAPMNVEPKDLAAQGDIWEQDRVILGNLVDLGTNVTREFGGSNPTIVVRRPERPSGSDTNRPPWGPPPGEAGNTNQMENPPPGPPPWNERRERRDGRPPFGRPFGMSEEEFKVMSQKQGVHSFIIALSTASLRRTCSQDLWLRSIICAFASASVLGTALAWSNLSKSADLQIRLVRASEMNSHLKELNIAAAGLAHETRNPLNIIRGLAHMISKQQECSPEIQRKSREIMDEADRVTAQLNEFINYSRPRELRRTAVPLATIIGEVVRALSGDVEEKKIHLQVVPEALTVHADEQLLRQALFNLLLNAIQAVPNGGEIVVQAEKAGAGEAKLEIRDNGPGVPAERREEIFKPYFTTNENGTGLGLAVVQQIVLAHEWEIQCLANQPQGAVFRLTHLKLAV